MNIIDDEGVVGGVEDSGVLLRRLQQGVVLPTTPAQVGPGPSVLPAKHKINNVGNVRAY